MRYILKTMASLSFAPHTAPKQLARTGQWLACGLLSLPLGLQAQPHSLEGVLETGTTHSVLWFASPESGDLIGQVFSNNSQAGQTILGNCLPDMYCSVEGAITADVPAALSERLNFKLEPAGWWQIQRARDAHMQASLPMSEVSLLTRFGQLSVTEEDKVLLLNGRPVLYSPVPASVPTAVQATSAADELATRSERIHAEPAAGSGAGSNAGSTWLQRLTHWWQETTAALRRKLWALLGRAASESEQKRADPLQAHQAPSTKAPPTQAKAEPAPNPAPTTTIATAAAVQGNAYLHIVAHFEFEDRDLILLQSTGGTACPALYRFLTLHKQGGNATPEFGSCSDLAAFSFAAETDAPTLTMPGFLGPCEPAPQRAIAERRLHRYTLLNGQIKEQKTQY